MAPDRLRPDDEGMLVAALGLLAFVLPLVFMWAGSGVAAVAAVGTTAVTGAVVRDRHALAMAISSALLGMLLGGSLRVWLAPDANIGRGLVMIFAPGPAAFLLAVALGSGVRVVRSRAAPPSAPA